MPPIAEDDTPHHPTAPRLAAARPPRKSLRGAPQIQKTSQTASPPYYVRAALVVGPSSYENGPRGGAASDSSDKRTSSDSGLEKSKIQLQYERDEAAERTQGDVGWFKRWTDRQWFGSRRKRWGLFISFGLLAVGVIVGLAVGLTLGLRDG